MSGFSSGTTRRLLLSAAALGVVAAVPAPAFAGGRYGGHYYQHYQPRHYSYGHYSHYRNYRYHGYRGHGGGHISAGEGALIAAGIIGGVILIDRALDNRDRYDDRRYDRRYDDRYDDRDRRGAFNDDYYYQRDDRYYDDRYAARPYDDRARSAIEREDRGDIDDALLGDGRRNAGATLAADAAFRECVAETRGAAGAGGMTVAMPGAPTEVERLADGSVRMTAQFRASNPRGESWTRRFVCEADEGGVRFLQVD